MYSLMLNPHHDYPSIRVPTDLRTDPINHSQHNILDGLPIISHLADSGPVIVVLIQVIPVHFVNSDCKDGLEFRVYSLGDQTFVEQLVDVQAGSVTVIEDEGVPQGLGFGVKGFGFPDQGEQLFVNEIGVKKIFLNFLPGASVLKGFRAQVGFHSGKILKASRRHRY